MLNLEMFRKIWIGLVMLIPHAICFRLKTDFRIGSSNEMSHDMIIKDYYRNRMTWTTSNLGAFMYKNIDVTIEERSRNFVVLIYKHWNFLKGRIAVDRGTNKYNPLYNCPVQNCYFTGDDSKLATVDAVIVYMFKGDLPNVTNRNPHQRWIFFSDESPINTFAGAKTKPNIPQVSNIFNWSMTYRSDSDIPIPYGRTIPLIVPVFPPEKTNFDRIATLVPFWQRKRRDVLVTVLMSHCVNHRMKYIKHLRKLIKIDFFGKCSNTYKLRRRCPGHYHSDCDVISNYLFYLVLENTSCRQYMTEKLFYNAFYKGAIPIIRHPIPEDCQRLLPPNSFLHVDKFGSPAQLVEAINSIGADDKKILSFHVWRNHFNVTNEHGFLGSEPFQCCRVCEALNYNSLDTKVYDEDEMRLFIDPKIICNTIHENQFVSYRRVNRDHKFAEDTEVGLYTNLRRELRHVNGT